MPVNKMAAVIWVRVDEFSIQCMVTGIKYQHDPVTGTIWQWLLERNASDKMRERFTMAHGEQGVAIWQWMCGHCVGPSLK